ncbi:putative quinol monooxygenase [Chishuiella sp.]|uniref:putative quinol monooxygenase n=1 Tax=Chishuiella sp. TaxID=1969467 RepID=UPI0028AB2237|nr:putative quinol monooxygenase [Chishuiella sp.]
MKIYVTAIVKSKPEFREELKAILDNLVVETRKENASILYDLHRSIEDENTFVFYEIWENKEGLDQHNKQPHIQKFVDFIDGKLQEAAQIYVTKIV